MRKTTPLNSAPRVLAARALREVLNGRSLSEVLPLHLIGSQDPRDRSLIQELCYGVMRWLPRLQGVLGQLLQKPLKARDRDVNALLLMGLYQLHAMRIASHAAVYETAEAAQGLHKRWAVRLINGVLREYQRREDELLANLEADPPACHAMPQWLLSRLQQRWPAQWRARVEALNQRPPMSLRVNLSRLTREVYLQRLRAADIEAEAVLVTRSGVMLRHPMDVAELPGFTDGLVSVQDGGAQLATELLDLQAGQQVLDACAAPGGKTGHMLESAQPLHLTALDVDATRLQQVRQNLQRLSLQADIMQGDAAKPGGVWAQQEYDRVLLDVPCSATGVMRRHPDIKYLRRATDIAPLAALQGEILRNVWRRVRPGGVLLYATCSLLSEENEQQVSAFLDRHGDAVERPIEADWGEPRSVGRQTLPGEQGMDGFYYARLHKRAS